MLINNNNANRDYVGEIVYKFDYAADIVNHQMLIIIDVDNHIDVADTQCDTTCRLKYS